MRAGGSLDPQDLTVLDECPFCGVDAFSKQQSLDEKECVRFLCGECRLGYQIWLDERSPAEATILADWAAQVPRD